jgi:predicted Zn-ribbon and HTH transcriptional regulator
LEASNKKEEGVKMSINMEKFASVGHFAKFDPHVSVEARVAVVKMQCHCCGFEPDEGVVPPRICPKCHSRSWERYARPGGILDNADRFTPADRYTS